MRPSAIPAQVGYKETMKRTKTTTAQNKPTRARRDAPTPTEPEPQPTIGEYIDRRLYSMACDDAFGQFGTTQEAVIPGIIQEYVSKWRRITYM